MLADHASTMCNNFRYLDMSQSQSDKYECVTPPALQRKNAMSLQERYDRLTHEDKTEILVNVIDQMMDQMKQEEEEAISHSQTQTKPPKNNG